MKKGKILLIIIPIILIIGAISVWYFYNNKEEKTTSTPHFSDIKSPWIDSLIINLSLDEKIGNLIIYDVGKINPNKLKFIDYLVFDLHVGGIIFEADSVHTYINIVNRYQGKTKVPLLIALKQKNAYPNFLNDIIKLPSQIHIDAVNNDSLHKRISKQRLVTNKLLGINLEFFPNHLNLDTSIINTELQTLEMQNKDSILSCFAVNSENILKQKSILRKYINNNIVSVFIQHDNIIDTISHNLRTSSFIKDSLLHKGLIISEIKNISEVNNFTKSASDIMYLKNNAKKTISLIKKLIEKEILLPKDIDKKLLTILKAKLWAKLNTIENLQKDTVKETLNNIYVKQLKQNILEASITLVKNTNDRIPIKNINEKVFVYNIGNNFNHFTNQLTYYTDFLSRNISLDSVEISNISFSDKFNHYIINILTNNKKYLNYIKNTISEDNTSNITIINYGKINNLQYFDFAKQLIQVYNNTKTEQKLASQLIFGGISAKGKLPIMVKELNYFPITSKKTRLGYTIPEEFLLSSDSILLIDSIVNDAMLRHAFPGCQIFVAKKGKVIFSKSYGYHTYAHANKVQWNDLYDIASITKIAGTTLATMKMQEAGKLSINANIERYFKNTYIEYTRIKPDTTIDIDTVNIREITTKKLKKLVAGNDTINLNDSLVVIYDTVYWKVTPNLNLFKRTVKEMLMHRSGLPPSMPILRYIMYRADTNITIPDSFMIDKDKYIVFDTLINRRDTFKYLFNKYYSRKYLKDTARVQIAQNLYLRKEYEDTLWIDTKQIRVYSKSVFMYSDVNPIIVQQVIDTINGYSIDKYLDNRFYNPLGCRTICYKPLRNFKRNRITPTENDKYWRGQVIHGHVHDPSAALIGGIAGNAGLFSNATDLGIIFQMLLNGGYYGGRKYLNSSTIRQFTSFQEGTHRGIGFDKGNKKNIIGRDASPNSYGHTGFTGTCVWVDEKEELVYVFLSNRVHPSVKNWQINTIRVRQKVHQAVYNARVLK